jgi:RNA polymerase sigma-B factor
VSDPNRQRRDALVERYMPLARKLARRYNRGREPYEDLVQVASEALVKAAEGYDPTFGCTFATYAVPSISGALKRYFRDCTWIAYVPRRTKESVLELRRAVTRLEAELGREPNDAELAAVLDAELEDVRETRAAAQAQAALSLDAPSSGGGEDPDDPFFLGVVPAPEILEDDIEPLLRALPRRDRAILSLRFRDELTQREIADRVGMSQMHVSRVLKQSLAQLRQSAGVRELAEAA